VKNISELLPGMRRLSDFPSHFSNIVPEIQYREREYYYPPILDTSFPLDPKISNTIRVNNNTPDFLDLNWEGQILKKRKISDTVFEPLYLNKNNKIKLNGNIIEDEEVLKSWFLNDNSKVTKD